MKEEMSKISLFLSLIFFLSIPSLWAASSSPARSKPEAAMKGYLYESSHDDIVSKAKKEGALRALFGLNLPTITAAKEAFSKKYPFIDCYFEEITGAAQERLLLELQSGRVTDWDVLSLQSENYNQLRPYVEKIDFLAMARQKILNIPITMISPQDRNALSLSTFADIAAYNSKLLNANEVPATWEDFLKPKWKGRKFVLDIKPNYLAGLVPAKGMQWALDYARKLAVQDPIWTRGQTRALTSLGTGEYALTLGTYYHSLLRAKNKVPQLEPLFLEPVPIRLGEAHGVHKGTKHPYAAILLMEFMTSPEGQRIIDATDPAHASVFAPGSMLEQVIAKRKLSVLDWDHFAKREQYVDELFKAFGFPTAK